MTQSQGFQSLLEQKVHSRLKGRLRKEGSISSLIPLWIGLFLLWYLMVLRPQSSQKAQRAQLLDNLKKNDKVVTTGGIVGTVANVHENNGEVTIRSGDTPIRVLRDAIREVIDESTKDADKAS